MSVITQLNDTQKDHIRKRLLDYINSSDIPTIEEFTVLHNLLPDILYGEDFYAELSLLKSKAHLGLRQAAASGDISQLLYRARVQELEDSLRQHKQLQDEKTKSFTKKADLYNELQKTKLDMLKHGLVSHDLVKGAYHGFVDGLSESMLAIGKTELAKWEKIIEEGRKTEISALEIAKYILQEVETYTITKIKLNKRIQIAKLDKKVSEFYKEQKVDEIPNENHQVKTRNTEKIKKKDKRQMRVEKVDAL